jgi:hypothetical protein
MMLIEEQELVTFATEAVCANSDRAVWRFDIYFRARDWMRSIWQPCLQKKREWKVRSIRIMRAIVSNVAMKEHMDKDRKLSFARELKLLWYKVKNQVENEFGDHVAQDYAQSLQNCREEEGISD